ncbi:hypothetical protein BGZ67_006870 [Mortierella alpina]|nr:hypothetical protein BGZ67_006870 [Mortierella alpina]
MSTAEGRYERPHDWPAESDRPNWRYGSYSPPGGAVSHSVPSPYEIHPRQLSSDGSSYPPPSNAHHNSHPSLQQQQPPLPLYHRGDGAPSQDPAFEEPLDEGRGHVAVKREPDADRLRDGNWSDGAAGQEPRAGHSNRGAQEIYSEFRSTLSASYWKESQRVIRASVSESDLLAAEASQRQAASRIDYPEDDLEEGDDQDEVDEDESDQIDELEEDEEEKEHIRVRSDEGLQYSYRQHPDGQRGVPDDRRHAQQQQHPYGFDYDQESKRSFAGYGPPRSREAPPDRYQCQYCHKRFSRPSSLRIHTYSHTGERPFKCSEEGCGRQFSVQSNMRRHLRVHRMGRMRPEFPPRD